MIRLEKGEEIHEKLTAFCKEREIRSGVFHAIGAVLSAELGFYHLDKKTYAFKQFNRPMEIVSLTGNVSLVDNEPFLHIHAVLGDDQYQTIGGHLKEGVVGATCEVFLMDGDVSIERTQVDAIGLKLWNLE